MSIRFERKGDQEWHLYRTEKATKPFGHIACVRPGVRGPYWELYVEWRAGALVYDKLGDAVRSLEAGVTEEEAWRMLEKAGPWPPES